MKYNVGILCGGYSGEAEVSLRSGKVVHKHLQADFLTTYLLIINKQEWYVEFNEKKYTINKGDFSADIEGERVTFDVVFMATHGHPGEDGIIQAYLNLLNIP